MTDTNTVWVLLRTYAYEGDSLIGVYTTEQAANDAVASLDWNQNVTPTIERCVLDAIADD